MPGAHCGLQKPPSGAVRGLVQVLLGCFQQAYHQEDLADQSCRQPLQALLLVPRFCPCLGALVVRSNGLSLAVLIGLGLRSVGVSMSQHTKVRLGGKAPVPSVSDRDAARLLVDCEGTSACHVRLAMMMRLHGDCFVLTAPWRVTAVQVHD